jgi:FkbM family methyltransferase
MFKFLLNVIKCLIGTGIGNFPLVGKIYQIFATRCLDKVIETDSFKIQTVVDGYVGDLATRLIFRGNFEPATSKIFKLILKEGDRVIDVGANVGYFSLLASSIVKDSGKVFSFEPDPKNMKSLNANILLNGFNNICVYQVAISDFKGKSNFYISNNDPTHSLIKTKIHTNNIMVDVDKLDNIDVFSGMN